MSSLLNKDMRYSFAYIDKNDVASSNRVYVSGSKQIATNPNFGVYRKSKEPGIFINDENVLGMISIIISETHPLFNVSMIFNDTSSIHYKLTSTKRYPSWINMTSTLGQKIKPI